MKKSLNKIKACIQSGFSKLTQKQRKLLILSLLFLFIAIDILYIVAGFKGKTGSSNPSIEHVHTISIIDNKKKKSDLTNEKETNNETNPSQPFGE